MKYKNYLKVISSFVSLIMIFSLVFIPNAQAASKADLEQQIAELDKKISSSTSKLNQIKSDMSKQEEYIATLREEIKNLESQVTLINQKMALINGDILETNKKIAAKNLEIEDKQNEIKEVTVKIEGKERQIKETITLLCKRLRATYMAGKASELEILLSAQDFASFLTTSEMLKRVAQHDDEIVSELNGHIEELAQMQDKLETEKTELEEAKTELNKQKTSLETQLKEQKAEQKVYADKQTSISAKYAAANQALDSLDEKSSAYKNQLSAFAQQEADLERQIQNIINGSTSGGSSSGGSSSGNSGGNSSSGSVSSKGYISPVPYSDAYISSPYGYRTHPISGTYKFHSGIDISCGGAGGKYGPFTKKIVASKSGTVIYAGPQGGYGNTIMIDHGGGYVTLYAHNYTLNVSVGQTVTQGQQIAIMGTTGNSTGAHCHFEVRYNGSTVNPVNYVKV